MRECKLRSYENWQGALQQKGIKQGHGVNVIVRHIHTAGAKN
jgi:hypothetical protein